MAFLIFLIFSLGPFSPWIYWRSNHNIDILLPVVTLVHHLRRILGGQEGLASNFQGVFGWRNPGFLFKLGQTILELWAWYIVALVASQLCLFYISFSTRFPNFHNRLGSDVDLASQSIHVITSSITWQGPFALGIATSIRATSNYNDRRCHLTFDILGYFLGERDTLRAGAAAKGAVAVGFAIAGLMRFVSGNLVAHRSESSKLTYQCLTTCFPQFICVSVQQ
ncbi:hypothetical protein F5890DRAFT_1603791 [Lentinula detonsa]|uniref:Uncharacterized protein n=1 Tax=Lentinula detonsa TaxID=2804962 RepID=A0AA38UL13_9AGAR|nr:hypothetical protein F5890DRAFT_1603791 [Lentinula detonsa]